MSGLFYERQVSMAQPKLVIFDCDGVLVDSEPLTDAVMQKSFAHYGLDLPITQINSLFVGGTMTGAMHQARALGAALPDHWLKEIYTEIYSVLEQSVELVPGVTGVLDELDRAGIGYAVGSNGRTPQNGNHIGAHRLAGTVSGAVLFRAGLFCTETCTGCVSEGRRTCRDRSG